MLASLLGAFGNQAFALPDKLGGQAIHFFGDASAKGVVAVGNVSAVGQGDAGEAMLAVVVVAAPVKGLAVEGQCAAIGRFDLADFVGFETSLFVVLVLAEQLALLAHQLAAALETVPGERLAVEVDGFEVAAQFVAVVQAVVVGQFAVAELAEGVVLVAQGGPALVFGNEAVLQVVFVGQRPCAIVDGGEAAERQIIHTRQIGITDLLIVKERLP